MKTLMLDHVGIAVESLNESLKFYSGLLGLELKGTETVEEQKVRTAFLPGGRLAQKTPSPTAESGFRLWRLAAVL